MILKYKKIKNQLENIILDYKKNLLKFSCSKNIFPRMVLQLQTKGTTSLGTGLFDRVGDQIPLYIAQRL